MPVWNYANEVAADAPYLHWRCRDSTGPTTADASGNGNDGTYFGTDLTFGEKGIHSDETDTIVYLNPSGSTYDAGISLNPVPAGFPTTDLTLEWVSRDDTPGAGRTLWSYCDSGGVQPDTIRVVYSNYSNRIEFEINGVVANLSTAFSPFTRSTQALQHNVLTWRSSDGRAQWFLNGYLMATQNISVGFSIPAGGGLVIGQDQDSLLGGYVTTEALRIVAGEFAVYDTVLSDARIRVHASAALIRYVDVDEVPLTIGDLGNDVAPFDIRSGGQLTYLNRVFDHSAGRLVFWKTVGAPDLALGVEYPGPGTFDPTASGSDTSAHFIQAILR